MSAEKTKVQSQPLLYNAGLHVDKLEKLEMEREAAKHGLGVITAAIFLAGEMAGSGVLALPFAMVGTGKNLQDCLVLTLENSFRLGRCDFNPALYN